MSRVLVICVFESDYWLYIGLPEVGSDRVRSKAENGILIDMCGLILVASDNEEFTCALHLPSEWR